MKREYFARVGVNKVYQGAKSVNVNIDSDQALEMAVGMIRACKSHKKVDLAFYIGTIKQKPGGKIPQGKIVSTVTAT